MKIEELELSTLIPYDKNPRRNENAVDYVAESIKQFGFKVPIVIDKDNVIIAGHTRYLASQKLGLTKVPCIKADDLTEEQVRAYRLADNKVSEFATWDLELLNEELEDIFNIDMEDFGFDIGDDIFEEEIPEKKNTDFFYFSKDEIIEDVVNDFKTYNSVEEYVKNIMSIPKAKYQFNRLCQGYEDGYNISLLFNPHRLDTPTVKSISMYEAINTSESYRRAFAKYLVNVQNKVVTESEFYKYIGIGSGGIQYVNEFQPYLARDIYKKYCKDGDVVLDPCSGWGGRTLGLASCMFENIKYITSDPSTRTYNGLLKLKEFLNLGDNYQYNNVPFEELELEENSIDFCFTSPPYFDTERYSDEDTQSYKSNDGYDEWRVNFLYVMLDKIIYALKEGSYCLLNVGKVRYPIDEDIIQYLKSKGIKYRFVEDFKIGGVGIGARTDEEGKGEPFIEFMKPIDYSE